MKKLTYLFLAALILAFAAPALNLSAATVTDTHSVAAAGVQQAKVTKASHKHKKHHKKKHHKKTKA